LFEIVGSDFETKRFTFMAAPKDGDDDDLMLSTKFTTSMLLLDGLDFSLFLTLDASNSLFDGVCICSGRTKLCDFRLNLTLCRLALLLQSCCQTR
jgi:hypothetical protein